MRVRLRRTDIKNPHVLALCALTCLVSCDLVDTRLDHSTRPEIYAYPDHGGPDIKFFPHQNGRTGVSLTTIFAGEEITHQWKPVDSVSLVLFHPIATSCRSEAITSIKADRAKQEMPTRVSTEYDLVSPFLSCMASQEFKGQQTDIVHPSRFLFGIRHQGLGARYEAKKKTAFAQFKSDVDSCGTPLWTGKAPVVRESKFEPTWTGHTEMAFGATYQTIEPAGSVLRQCMEALGYEVEDRSMYP